VIDAGTPFQGIVATVAAVVLFLYGLQANREGFSLGGLNDCYLVRQPRGVVSALGRQHQFDPLTS